MVTYDKTTLNKIEFMLPNDKMASLKLVTTQQQVEINNSVKRYTNGKNYIDWSMVGVINALNIIRAIKRQQKLLKDSYFNKMKADMHFNHIDILENSIVFELDGTEMCKLNSQWEIEIANEFKKYKMFHNFESVIINRKNKNKYENKNKNENTTNGNKKDKNIDTFDSLLDVWDMEINNVQNELKRRKKEICNIMIESFGCSTVIYLLNAQLDSLFKEYNTFDIESYLKQIEKNNEKENIFNQEFQLVKNELELEKENIFNQEMKIKERERININIIQEFKTCIEKGRDFLMEQQRQEKQELNITEKSKEIDEIVIECENLMKEYDNSGLKIEREVCQLNDMVNDIEWTIFKRTFGNEIKLAERKSMPEENNVGENVFDQMKIKHSGNGTFIECAIKMYEYKNINQIIIHIKNNTINLKQGFKTRCMKIIDCDDKRSEQIFNLFDQLEDIQIETELYGQKQFLSKEIAFNKNQNEELQDIFCRTSKGDWNAKQNNCLAIYVQGWCGQTMVYNDYG